MSRTVVLCLPWIVAALAVALVIAWLASATPERVETRATLSVTAAMSQADLEGYQRALSPREFQFPADHAAHDGFKTEWWYFTGNLENSSGRRFGYQLTFFRSALTPRPLQRTANFAADHAWMAHFTLSDVEAERFESFERFARESAGIAGATQAPVQVWLRDWRCDFSADGTPLHLVAREGEIAIDLKLDSRKPAVLHGERGLSRKGSKPGAASYYYSLTRMETAGRIAIGAQSFDVRGLSWMDREWMSAQLDDRQVGWDWFSLQFDDESELMWYRLRRSDGKADANDSGTFVAADGTTTSLRWSELKLTEHANWKSPRSQANYPARWTLEVERLGLKVELTPALADQELETTFRYWEGCVDAAGTREARAIGGRGYVELVGYSEQATTPTRANLR